MSLTVYTRFLVHWISIGNLETIAQSNAIMSEAFVR